LPEGNYQISVGEGSSRYAQYVQPVILNEGETKNIEVRLKEHPTYVNLNIYSDKSGWAIDKDPDLKCLNDGDCTIKDNDPDHCYIGDDNDASGWPDSGICKFEDIIGRDVPITFTAFNSGTSPPKRQQIEVRVSQGDGVNVYAFNPDANPSDIFVNLPN